VTIDKRRCWPPQNDSIGMKAQGEMRNHALGYERFFVGREFSYKLIKYDVGLLRMTAPGELIKEGEIT
jgi:hypothetical protein